MSVLYLWFYNKTTFRKKKCLGFSIFQAYEWNIAQCQVSCCEEGKHPLKWPKSEQRSLWWTSWAVKLCRGLLPASLVHPKLPKALSRASSVSRLVASAVNLLLSHQWDIICSRKWTKTTWPTGGLGQCVVMQYFVFKPPGQIQLSWLLCC